MPATWLRLCRDRFIAQSDAIECVFSDWGQ